MAKSTVHRGVPTTHGSPSDAGQSEGRDGRTRFDRVVVTHPSLLRRSSFRPTFPHNRGRRRVHAPSDQIRSDQIRSDQTRRDPTERLTTTQTSSLSIGPRWLLVGGRLCSFASRTQEVWMGLLLSHHDRQGSSTPRGPHHDTQKTPNEGDGSRRFFFFFDGVTVEWFFQPWLLLLQARR